MGPVKVMISLWIVGATISGCDSWSGESVLASCRQSWIAHMRPRLIPSYNASYEDASYMMACMRKNGFKLRQTADCAKLSTEISGCYERQFFWD